MHSTVRHRRQRATPSRSQPEGAHADADTDGPVQRDPVIWRSRNALEALVERVFLLTTLRWQEVRPGTFFIQNDRAYWLHRYIETTCVAPIGAVGSLGLSWDAYDEYTNHPGRKHRDIGKDEEAPANAKAKADPSDVERRFQVIVNAAQADEWERAEDTYGRPLNVWCCPTHDDEHPSLHINPDLNTGYILAKCQSGGDDCGNKYTKDHPLYTEHRKQWIRELARLLDIPTGTFYPIRKAELPDDHEPPF